MQGLRGNKNAPRTQLNFASIRMDAGDDALVASMKSDDDVDEASFERAEVNGKEVYRVVAKGKGTATAFRQKLAEMGYPGAIERR